jgi:hypothetical protein
MTEVARTAETKCACHSDDAYDCWQSRYPSNDASEVQTAQEIEMDGGPCSCSCHDRRDEDYDPAEYL